MESLVLFPGWRRVPLSSENPLFRARRHRDLPSPMVPLNLVAKFDVVACAEDKENVPPPSDDDSSPPCTPPPPPRHPLEDITATYTPSQLLSPLDMKCFPTTPNSPPDMPLEEVIGEFPEVAYDWPGGFVEPADWGTGCRLMTLDS